MGSVTVETGPGFETKIRPVSCSQSTQEQNCYMSASKKHTVTCLSPRDILSLAREQDFQRAHERNQGCQQRFKDISSEVAREHKLAATMVWHDAGH